MSLPNPERELLLSAALDGELSGVEQAQFDRAVADDPALAREYEELQTLCATLRHGFAELRTQTMPPGAADRIVAAAMSGSAPTSVADQTAQPNPWKWAAALSLAASTLVAISLWSRSTGPKAVALLDNPASADAVVQNDIDKPLVDESPESKRSIPEMIAVVEAATPPETPPKLMGIKPTPEAAPVPSSIANLGVTASAAASMEPAADKLEVKSLALVLMVSVELTQAGRDQSALQEALRVSDIRLNRDSVMGSEVVSQLRSSNVIDTAANSSASTAKLYLIDASAKRIDELISILTADKDSFDSVGFGLADDLPLLAAISELPEVDPTQVLQTGVARDLTAADGKSLSISPNYPLAPLDKEFAATGLTQSLNPPTANASNDPPSQLLLLVK